MRIRISNFHKLISTTLATRFFVAVAQGALQAEPTLGEWPVYGEDLANTRYSPLAQIDASNVSELEIAW